MTRNMNNMSTSARTRRRKVHKPTAKSLGVQLQTTLANGPVDPIDVTPDVIMAKKTLYRAEIANVVPGTTRYRTIITPTVLANTVPAIGVTKIRIMKLSVFGPSEPANNIELSDQTSDAARFNDTGVPGQSRPAIHILPSLQVAQTWRDSTDTTPLYYLTGTYTGTTLPTGFTFYVQATIEYRVQGPVVPIVTT